MLTGHLLRIGIQPDVQHFGQVHFSAEQTPRCADGDLPSHRRQNAADGTFRSIHVSGSLIC